jgi:uncharacterized membrane protein YvlD (DUF360 family)
LLYLFVVDVVLFVLASALYNHGHVLRDISNVAWVAFLIGIVLLVVLGIVALLRSRRPARGTAWARAQARAWIPIFIAT